MKEQLQAFASKLTTKTTDRSSKSEVKTSSHKKKPKPPWLDYVQYGVELLKAYFPNGFKSGNEIRPLKKGIKQDLVLRLSTLETITIDDKACMVKSLSYYVNTAIYHKNVVEGAPRIDLDGNQIGVVSAEEAKYSIDRQQAKLQLKKVSSSSLPFQSSSSTIDHE